MLKITPCKPLITSQSLWQVRPGSFWNTRASWGRPHPHITTAAAHHITITMSSNKEVALAIIKFLQASVASKTINEEFSDSIDVAIDCIADAFEVDKGGSASAGDLTVASAKTGAPAAKEVDAETKAQADALKAEGNKAMAGKDFAYAIAKYTEAIELDGTNVVYLSNRAAAHSLALQHDKAVEDAEKAIALDPTFSKAYSRLGLAQYALGNAKAAMEAYKKGMEIEGTPSEAMKRGYETAKKRVEEELESSMALTDKSVDASGASGASGASAGAGAGAGAGGMPDFSLMFGGGGMPSLSEMMNNPQVMEAAQNLMSNPLAMQGLMNNPMLRLMAQNMGGEGGLEGLMNNPALQNMARQFMGGQNNQDGQSEQ